MHKKFEINRTKIKGGCQSGRKVVTHNSKSDLPLVSIIKKVIDTLVNLVVTDCNVQKYPYFTRILKNC